MNIDEQEQIVESLGKEFTSERNPEARAIATELNVKGVEHIEVERPYLPKLTSSIKASAVTRINEKERIAQMKSRTSPEEFKDIVDIGGDVSFDDGFEEELPSLVKKYKIDRWGRIKRNATRNVRRFFLKLAGSVQKVWFEHTNKKVRKEMVKDLQKKELPAKREFAIKGIPVKDITVEQLEEISRNNRCCIRNPRTGTVVIGGISDVSRYPNHEVVPMMIHGTEFDKAREYRTKSVIEEAQGRTREMIVEHLPITNKRV